MNLRDTKGFLLLSGLTSRDRRAILVGLTILLPALTYVFGVRPYRTALGHLQDRIVVERELLQRELALLESAPSFPGLLDRAEAEAILHEDRLVLAPSGVLAEAVLTGFLESAAARSRVLLEEIRGGELGRGEEPPAGLSVVRLHLRGESDLEGVLTFLDEVEEARLLLRIRGLALEPDLSRAESENDENGRNREPVPTGVVGFQLILDGFARVEEGQ